MKEGQKVQTHCTGIYKSSILLLTQEAKQKSSIDYYGKEATCMGASNIYQGILNVTLPSGYMKTHVFQNADRLVTQNNCYSGVLLK